MVLSDSVSTVPGALRLSLFGPVQLHAPDDAEIVIANRRARALLAMLALEPDRPMMRERASELLWPGRFAAQARASLRQCLLDLGRLLAPVGSEAVVVTRDRLGLRAELWRTDLSDLESSLAAGDAAAATAALQAIGARPLLEDFSFGGAFETWIEACRLRTEQRLQATLKSALADLERRGDLTAHAALLEAWAVRDTTAWRHAITSQDGAKVRIAVLPFAALGLENGQDYFADGMADELITTLGQSPQLRVAGRTSSFHFRNSDLPAPEIAAALRVTHLIEGSVQRQGAQVRIGVRLVDGETGFEIWGQRYDGGLDAIFVLQERVAQAVTHALGAALDLALPTPAVRGATPSKAAYDFYLQGRSLCARLFGDGVLDRAIGFFEQALALDPDFAEAWLGLAEAQQMVAVYTPCLDRAAASARMAECARKAIALMPTLGYAHSLLGVHQWTQNDIVGALDLAFKGYGLEPDNPAVAMRLGSFLLYCGRTAEAMKYVEAAIEQDPVDGRKYNLLAVGNFNLGNIAAARSAGQRMVDLGFPSMWLGVSSAAAGEHELAVAQYRQTRALMNTVMFPPAGAAPLTPDGMDAFWLLAANGVCSGREEERRIYCQVLDLLHATLHDPADPSVVLPAIFMGYADMVFKSVGQRITPANTLCLQSLWADVEPIRQIYMHPEFIPFAQRIGMAAAWDKYGWPDLLPPPQNLPPRTN